MATYLELYGLRDEEDMRNKVAVAIAIAADIIKTDGDTTDPPWSQAVGAHDARLAWVKNADAFSPTIGLIQTVWNAMLAANESASVATITGATDTTIQNNVNESIDVLANGETV